MQALKGQESMEKMVEFWRHAWAALRKDPRDYFRHDFDNVDDTTLYLAGFGGIFFSTLVYGFASGYFGMAITGSIFLFIPILASIAIVSLYTLLFCNLIFAKPNDFKTIWRLFVGLAAIVAPVMLISALLSPLPGIGWIASLAYSIAYLLVTYFALRHYLDLSHSQMALLVTPIMVLSLVVVIVSATIAGTYLVGMKQLAALSAPTETTEQERVSKLNRRIKELEKIIDVESEKLEELQVGELYRYDVSSGKKTGKLSIKILKAASTAKSSNAKIRAKVELEFDTKETVDTVRLPQGATKADLYKALAKSNPANEQYQEIVMQFLKAQGADTERLRAKGEKRIAKRTGTTYIDKKTNKTLVVDSTLPLPVVSWHDPKADLKITLAKYKATAQ
jgi:hypothetical protein